MTQESWGWTLPEEYHLAAGLIVFGGGWSHSSQDVVDGEASDSMHHYAIQRGGFSDSFPPQNDEIVVLRMIGCFPLM